MRTLASCLPVSLLLVPGSLMAQAECGGCNAGPYPFPPYHIVHQMVANEDSYLRYLLVS
jgi:hypothetical protein